MAGRVCAADFEEEAKKILPKSVYDYYRSGADGQTTLAHNLSAFHRYATPNLLGPGPVSKTLSCLQTTELPRILQICKQKSA